MTSSKTPVNSVQPHNLQAERTVLGAILLDPEAIYRVASQLSSNDFYDPVYRSVYAACKALMEQGKPVDFVTVGQQLTDDAKIQSIGGTAFLAELPADIPTASHIDQHASIVRDMAVRRSLIAAGQNIARIGYEQEAADKGMEEAQQALLEVATAKVAEQPEAIALVAERRYDQIAQIQQTGNPDVLRRVTSGFANIDYYFNGFAPGSLTVIAARPAMGKTAFATNVALNAARQNGKRVLFFSLEMSKDELADRITAAGLGVSTWKLEKGDVTDEQITSLGEVIDGLQDFQFYIDDDHDTTLSNLRSKAIAHKLQHGLDLLVVDYLQLVEVPREARHRENRVQEISMISRGLKQLARQLDVPVIALSQLNRAVESAPQAIPHLSHLRESGSIEQDAHNVLMLWREGYYNEECEHPNLVTVFIRKNRQGPDGAAELVFDRELMTFAALDRSRDDSATV